MESNKKNNTCQKYISNSFEKQNIKNKPINIKTKLKSLSSQYKQYIQVTVFK